MQDTATGGTSGPITELQKTKDEAKKQGEEAAALDALTATAGCIGVVRQKFPHKGDNLGIFGELCQALYMGSGTRHMYSPETD